MGSFLSTLKSNNNSSGSNSLPDARVDLQNAKPTQNELVVYEKLESLLVNSAEIITSLKYYEGCTEQIRETISKPTDENKIMLYNKLKPNLKIIKTIHLFSKQLKEIIQKTLEILLSSDNEIVKTLEKNQALVNLLTKILDFVFEFDNVKLNTPKLQNDFSYYKRMINSFKKTIKEELPINENDSTNISMFLANSSPMLKALVESTNSYAKPEMHNNEKITSFLVGLVGICYYAITKDRIKDKETKNILLKSMVVCSILYDHINTNGVFQKTSAIDIKIVIKCVESHGDTLRENLLNGLRYNTLHFNEASTPKKIKNSLSSNTTTH